MSTQEWDTRVEHAEAEKLRADNERLIRRCAHLQTQVMLAAGALELANGSLSRAVQRIDVLEAENTLLREQVDHAREWAVVASSSPDWGGDAPDAGRPVA